MRAAPGHWEGDLLSGPNNSYIATLVERHTRYVMLAKVAGKDTQTVVSALIKQTKKLSMTVIFDEIKKQPESVSIELQPLEDTGDMGDQD